MPKVIDGIRSGSRKRRERSFLPGKSRRARA
jgi:hypothetical protein